MKNPYLINPVIILIFIYFSSSFAQTNISYNEGAMLRWFASGKAASVGGAYTSVANGINAIYWNPANTTNLSGKQCLIVYLTSYS